MSSKNTQKEDYFEAAESKADSTDDNKMFTDVLLKGRDTTLASI